MQRSKESTSGLLGIYASTERDSSFLETAPLVFLFPLSLRVYPINIIDTLRVLVELNSPSCLCLVTHRKVRPSFVVVHHSTHFGLKQWNWQTHGIVSSARTHRSEYGVWWRLEWNRCSILLYLKWDYRNIPLHLKWDYRNIPMHLKRNHYRVSSHLKQNQFNTRLHLSRNQHKAPLSLNANLNSI